MIGVPTLGAHHNARRIVRDRFLRVKEQLFRSISKQDNGIIRLPTRRLHSTLSLVQLQTNRCSRHNASNLHPTLAKSRNVSGKRHFCSTKSENNVVSPLVSFSSISETPLDSTVMEQPYTVILMEDDVSESLFGLSTDTNHTPPDSWVDAFSKIPQEYGMAFASISLQLKINEQTLRPISEAIEALKVSELPTISDAILVARGPCSSLCAQYYLESFPLKGLVMIDPILLQSTKNETVVSRFVSKLYKHDSDSLERFQSVRLRVEANAVPMMVVQTTLDNEWSAASRHVAERHGDPVGPYGSVPFLDWSISDCEATDLLDRLDQWIDNQIY